MPDTSAAWPQSSIPVVDSILGKGSAEADTASPPSLADRLHAWLAPQGARNVIDARTTLLLENMSAQLLRNETIPDNARSLLGRLQAPLTQIALEDKDFFLDAEHPARRLVQALIDVCLWCDPAKADDDAPYRTVAGIVERLCNASPPTASFFDDMLREIDAFVVQENHNLDSKLRIEIAEARRQESQSHTQKLAENEIAARLETGEVPGLIEDFLQAHWLRVLVFGFGVGDSKPEVLPKLLETMDDLIWSVKPKVGVEERKELINRLPAILAVLNAWLNVIKWQGAEREAFFTALATHHTAAMRAPAELTSRHLLEMRMDAVQKASEHQLTHRARQDQQAALAEFMPLVDRLVPGSWVELVRNNGGKVNCRALWVSPARSLFVFVAAPTRLVFTLADDALAQALRANRASVVAPGAIVERALAAALEELGVA